MDSMLCPKTLQQHRYESVGTLSLLWKRAKTVNFVFCLCITKTSAALTVKTLSDELICDLLTEVETVIALQTALN